MRNTGLQPPVAFGISFITEKVSRDTFWPSFSVLYGLPEITSNVERRAVTYRWAGKRKEKVCEVEKERERQASRFLCGGKRPSVLLWFQLLSSSVNRVISHGPTVYPRYSFLLYLGPVPFLPPFLIPRTLSRSFFISTDRYCQHGTECIRRCIQYSSKTS